MSPLRAILLALSKTPPVLMLLLIISLATLVTMMVTGRIAQQEYELSAKIEQKSSSISDRSPVIETIDTISAGTTITKNMVAQKRENEKSIWEDAITSMPNAVGRTVKHSIPANSQIREADLN